MFGAAGAMGGLRGSFADGEVFAHFVETLGPETANGQKVVHVFKAAVGFAHLQDLIGGGRADAGNLLELGGRRGVEIDGLGGRLLLGVGGKCERAKEEGSDQQSQSHRCILLKYRN